MNNNLKILTVFEESYVNTILGWQEDLNGNLLFLNYNVENFSEKAVKKIKKDCKKFQKGVIYGKITNDENDVDLAHCFWMTRNKQNGGFYDEYYAKNQKLQKFLIKRTENFKPQKVVIKNKKIYLE